MPRPTPRDIFSHPSFAEAVSAAFAKKSRKKNVVQCGLTLVSTSTRVTNAPKTDFVNCDRSVPDRYGVHLLSAVPAFPPVSQAFTGVAYLRRLAMHRFRVKREMAEREPVIRRGRQSVATNTVPTALEKLAARTNPLPGRRAWDSLRVVGCGGCRATLLGPSDEHLRADYRPRFNAKPLPPPVAGRDRDGRPLCASCKTEGGL